MNKNLFSELRQILSLVQFTYIKLIDVLSLITQLFYNKAQVSFFFQMDT